MRDLLLKEFKLCASPLSFLFILFGTMFFLPGYPVLCGAFFVTLGIYQSFQNAREANDITFSALLPVAKRDVVKGKFLFVCFVELCGVLLMTLAMLLRMTVLSEAAAYRSNFMMNANPFALAMAFVIFGLYNRIFLAGFFKTAYKIGRPFIVYTITAFLTISIAEALHHFPGLTALNAFGFEKATLQLSLLLCGIAAYALVTFLAYKSACKSFEKIDL